MTLRSQQQLSKTPEGHEAWRRQSMPVIQRQILSRLREPMSVQALLGHLTNFDMSQVSEAITTLAGNGWVLVEDPAQPEPGEEGGEPSMDAEGVLSDLMARRPVIETPPVLEEVSPVEDPGHSEPVVAPESPVSDRGTPAQERALLMAMGLIAQDPVAAEWTVATPFDSSTSTEGEDPLDDEEPPEEDEAPVVPTSASAGRVPESAPVAPSREAPSGAPKPAMDPRRQDVLRRIQLSSSTKRESREAIRAFRAQEKADQAAADATSRRLREQEEAEREALSRK